VANDTVHPAAGRTPADRSEPIAAEALGGTVSDRESSTSSLDPRWGSSGIDTTVAHPARRYDYWLGGKNNFEADRKSGDAIAAGFPTVRMAARENRAFLRRAVTCLAQEAGISQFLDIGAGLPTADNTHEIVQRLMPAPRVVYVDNDPLVGAHARALLTSGSGAGVTDYVEADARDPDTILEAAARTLDFGQPIALLLVAILQFIPDSDDPHGIVARLVGALAPGSHLVITTATNEYVNDRHIAEMALGRHGSLCPRSREQIARFFDGLELLPPGIVSMAHWRADNEPQPRPTAAEIMNDCAVARIP
jgi:S-adenosyl methyltransferase